MTEASVELQGVVLHVDDLARALDFYTAAVGLRSGTSDVGGSHSRERFRNCHDGLA